MIVFGSKIPAIIYTICCLMEHREEWNELQTAKDTVKTLSRQKGLMSQQIGQLKLKNRSSKMQIGKQNARRGYDCSI